MSQTPDTLIRLPSQNPWHHTPSNKIHLPRPQLRLLKPLKPLIEENLRVPLTDGQTQQVAETRDALEEYGLIVEGDVGLNCVEGVCARSGGERPGCAFDSRAADGVGENDLVDGGALGALGTSGVGAVGGVEGGGGEEVACYARYEG